VAISSSPLINRALIAAACIASATLLLIAIPPFTHHWTPWLSLTPLIALLCSRFRTEAVRPRRRAFLLGWVTGTLYFSASVYWLHELGPLFQSPALHLLPILLGAYLGLFYGVWAVWFHHAVPPDGASFKSGPNNLLLISGGAAAWCALEWIRGWFLTGFGWNSLGAPLANDQVLAQITELTGAHGLSFLAAWVNLAAVTVVNRLRADFGPRFTAKIRWEFTSTVVLIALVFSFGIRCLFQKDSPSVPLHIASLQQNVPQTAKFDPTSERSILNELSQMMDLVGAMSPPPDLVLWPEGSTPAGLLSSREMFEYGQAQFAKTSASFLVGTLETLDVDLLKPVRPNEPLLERVIRVADQTSSTFRSRNSALLVTEKGSNMGAYRKQHLVPFGEFLPFRDIAPSFLHDLIQGDIEAGSEERVLELPSPSIRLGVRICFEDTLEAENISPARQGAQILINLTNDAWFGPTAAPEQHLLNARLRAIETRLPLVRCSNTGATCAITPKGNLERALASHENGIDFRIVQVPLSPKPTFFVRHGNWFPKAALVYAIVAALLIRSSKPSLYESNPR
jgi:apolipoprotein N-acyltransferase